MSARISTPRPCAYCGTAFYPLVRYQHSQRFCSKKCSAAERANQTIKTCPVCGKSFSPYRGRRQETQVCCSRVCANKIRILPTPPETRFWQFVEKTDGCWLWTGSLSPDGYGAIRETVSTKHRKRILAHRLSYEIHNGPIAAGMIVCHTCDNPKCVNPAHLFVGTPADNMADRDAKNRQAKGERTRPETRAKGEAHGNSKLTEQQVIEIRRQYLRGNTSYSRLAAEYRVSRITIRDIVKRRSWSHTANQ